MLDSFSMACPMCGSMDGYETSFVFNDNDDVNWIPLTSRCKSCGGRSQYIVHVQCVYELLRLTTSRSEYFYCETFSEGKYHYPARWKAWRVTDDISGMVLSEKWRRVSLVLQWHLWDSEKFDILNGLEGRAGWQLLAAIGMSYPAVFMSHLRRFGFTNASVPSLSKTDH